jgi:hypothetical protein
MLGRIAVILLVGTFLASAGCSSSSSKWWPVPGFLDGLNNNATNARRSDGYSVIRDGRPEPF